jgi:O-antigen ligase
MALCRYDMIVESILRRLELFQRLILLFLLGFVPLVIDPNVMASFVDTKFIIVELLVLFLIIIEAVRLVFRPGRKTFSLISVSLIGLVIVHFLHALPAWLPGDTFLENLADAYPEYALVTALKYSLFLVLPLFFVSAFNTRKRLAMAENFLIIMSVPIFIYGLAQYTGYELFEYQLQMDKSNVHGMLGNAHYLGGYLAMLLFIVLHRVVATRNANLRPLLIFLTVVIVFLVYASKSRGAMLCVGASAFLFLGIRAFVGWRRKQHWFWRVVLAAWLLFWVALPLGIWYSGTLPESNFIRKTELQVHRDRSFNNRMVLSLVALRMWRQDPVWGAGVGQYAVQFFPTLYEMAWQPDFLIFRDMSRLMESTQANEAHNDFLQMLAELGIIGYALLVALCILSVAGLVMIQIRQGRSLERFDRRLALFLVPALLTVYAQMAYSFPFHLPANAVLMFFIFGLAMSVLRRYGALEIPRPRWWNHRFFRTALALFFLGFSLWAVGTVLRQYMGLVYMRAGYLALEEYNNPKAAETLLADAGVLYPENGEIDFYQARTYATDKKRLHKALEKLDEAEETFANSSIRLVRSQLLLEMFRFSEAYNVLEPLEMITRQLPTLHLARGMVYYHNGQYEKAIEEYEKELELQPWEPLALLYMAESHYHLGNYYRSEKLYLQAIQRNIQAVEAYERLGDIYAFHQFKPKQARQMYADARQVAVKLQNRQKIRQMENKALELERKIRLKLENPRFRLEMMSN